MYQPMLYNMGWYPISRPLGWQDPANLRGHHTRWYHLRGTNGYIVGNRGTPRGHKVSPGTTPTGVHNQVGVGCATAPRGSPRGFFLALLAFASKARESPPVGPLNRFTCSRTNGNTMYLAAEPFWASGPNKAQRQVRRSLGGRCPQTPEGVSPCPCPRKGWGREGGGYLPPPYYIRTRVGA